MIPSKEHIVSLRSTLSIKELAIHENVSRATICNWLKKYNLSKSIKKPQEFPPLTQRQKYIIDGSLLGDGYLDKRGIYNPRFNKVQCIAHSEYIDWHFQELSPYSRSIIDNYTGKLTRNESGLFVDYEQLVLQKKFYTSAHPVFAAERKKWYNEDGIKIVPKNLSLSPLTIAIWFADDGGNYRNKKEAIFHTDCFSLEDLDVLKTGFLCFGITSHITKHVNGHDIRIYGRNYDTLHDLIDPEITWKCFNRKRRSDID